MLRLMRGLRGNPFSCAVNCLWFGIEDSGSAVTSAVDFSSAFALICVIVL
jgi:hypothetical protein